MKYTDIIIAQFHIMLHHVDKTVWNAKLFGIALSFLALSEMLPEFFG